MLIPLRPDEKNKKEEDAEQDAAFEKFLLEEGLVLLRSFKAIEPPEIRHAIQKLVVTVRQSLGALIQREIPLDHVPPIMNTATTATVAARIAEHGSLHPTELTPAEIELVCRALLERQSGSSI